MTDKERFLEKVLLGPDCWEWQASKDPAGYGRFWLEGRMMPSQQAAYRLLVGPVPEGLSVLHCCHNRACCNPSHLRLGTQAENMADLAITGNSPLKKINAEEALKLRREGKSLREVAEVFGASKQAVRQILERTYGTSK